jgi:amino acid adenylation domain-containing protein/non-ribosomal peptide synthase protein (TIGR01720 family)
MDSLALERIKKLSPAKQRLLQQKLKAQPTAEPAASIPPSPRRGSTDRFPCSFSQQRLWFVQQLEPASTAYNAVMALRLRGPLDRQALQKALDALVHRHEILRTTFALEDEPVQVVHTSAPVEMRRIDLTGILGAGELPALIRQEIGRPFDLGGRPPLRAILVELGTDDHAVVLTVHHIVTDAWSLGVMTREVAALYDGFLQGRPASLPELSIQYADFAEWQRRRLAGPALAAELAYWRGQLAGLPPALELPLDRPRTAGRSFRGAKSSIRLSVRLLQALHELGLRHGATLFMTLLAAFKVVLFDYTGRQDLALGTPIAGRNHLQLEGLLGCFINTLILRTRLTNDIDFTALLRQVQEVTLGAYAHPDLPLEKLITELQPERDLARAPLYQVMFGVHNAPLGALRLAGLSLEGIPVEGITAKLDLILNATEQAEGLILAAEYDSDLFDATTLQRLLRHFTIVLEQVTADPAASVSAVTLLADEERQALLWEWNDTAVGTGAGLPVHELIRLQAVRRPDAPAVLHRDADLSFGQLQERAELLARHLRHHGVAPESRVGLYLDRTPELLVGILGILLAGAAYVPLDPKLPGERLAFILSEALGEAAPVLLTQESLSGRLPASERDRLRVLCLDTGWEEIAASSEENRGEGRETSPDTLAYVLYTSGSTGRPKGVAVHHRGLSNYLSWCIAAYEIAAGAGAPVHSSIGFDLTVTSLLAPLAAGRPAVLLGAEEDTVTALAEALGRGEGYSLVKLTPAHLRALGAVAPPAEIRDGTRALVIGGEALFAEDLAAWRRDAPATTLINEYGPTETVVGCAVHRITATTPASGPVLIGRPVANTHLYLLDCQLRPAPPGASGELYIGGTGVARGYLGLPDLTAERFLPDAFADAAGGRVYRTGDLARFRADGTLEFLGRVDEQVKLRGHRIELGEIEAVLGTHGAVRQAAVVLRSEGGAQLVACLVAAPGEPPAAEALNGFLAERLPDYMIPATYVFLDALPLTPNGKVDRSALSRMALAAVAAAPSAVTAEDQAPHNALEEMLAAVWCEVLRLERVGIRDNFFELGGDSILSLQVTSRMRKKGWRITSRQIFAGPTIAELAAAAQPIQTAADAAPSAATAEIPLTPVQRWFFDRTPPHPEYFNQALLLELRPLPEGRISIALLSRALDHLLTHHDTLRTRFEPPMGERTAWLQLLAAGPLPAPVGQVDLSALPEEHWRPALEGAAAAVQASLDLTRAPLLRTVLLTPGDGPDRLLLVAHHLIVDGVSWRVLLEDLETACRQIARGDQVDLPPRTTSFQRWAEQLMQHAGSAAVQAQAVAWLDLLDAPALPPLPLDRADGPNDIASSGLVHTALNAEATRALLQDLPRAYRTQINELLLAALAEAFAGWTGSRRLLVDLEAHGREEIVEGLDTSRTVGWFTTVYPVLLDVDGAGSPAQAVRRIKERLRAVPDRGIGYGLLRFLGQEGSAAALRALPSPEVVFNYLGQLDQTVAADRLFRGAAESAGAPRHAAQPRPYLLEIAASVAGGRLRATWTYGGNRHLRSTVEALAAAFIAALNRLVEHARCAEAAYIPSDFPLAHLAQADLEYVLALVPGEAQGIEDLYPASPVQQGMLFHSLQAPESGVYVEQLGLMIEESLDISAFEQAWQRLIDRHTILRTSFVWRDAEVSLQVVHARVAPPWDRQDWRGLPPAVQQSRWEELLVADRRRSFDVTTAPLLRLTLVHLGERSYRFLWTHHHVLLDGWSNAILLRELFRLYEAASRQEPAWLPPVRPFREYIAWLERQDITASEEFWRRELAGFSAPTPLVIDHPRAAASRRASRQLVLLPAMTDELRAFARRQGLTLSTLMNAAWAVLLSRYSSEADVLFGMVTSGRSAPLAGIEEMIGIFINTLPLRVRIDEEMAVPGWLQEIQSHHAEASQFEHSPLLEVQGWSSVQRGTALFHSIVAFENYPVDEAMEGQGRTLGVGGLEASGQTSYPLAVTAGVGARWSLRALFDASRLDDTTVDRMLRHLQILLDGMREEPTVGSLPLLHEVERQQLREWNATAVAFPAEETLASLFETRVDRAPDLPAVAGADGQSLSYAELEARANRLAHLLRRLGVLPGELVAVQLERSPAMVETLLGITKSGAAYLPLETSYPEERVRWILDRMNVRIAVLGNATLGSIAGLAPELPELRHLICLEEHPAAPLPPRVTLWEPGHLASCPVSRPARHAGPEDLAYVIFTSGSTGRPKGVTVRHRPAVNLIDWVNRTFEIGPGDRLLFVTSLCFDLSVYDIFGMLAAGGTVRVATQPELANAQVLAGVLAEEPITFWDSAPAALQQLVPFLPPAAAGREPALRLVFLSGDWVPLPLPGEIRASFPGAEVIALGGATEATVWSNFFPVARVEPAWRSVPYGRPIQNACYHILDGRLEPCPVGVPGDLYIAGACLSSGYAAAPDLTADRFVPDLFASEAGALMYRTGDRARFFPDGTMEFLGRLDHQVKIRGFRIELGEIEAALGQHPAVAEVLALAREDRPGDKVLTAYVVPREGAVPTAEELRGHLEKRLPEYMLPAAFLLLNAMPLTANGKVDRRALPGPDWTPQEGFAAPQGPSEELLAGLFADVLRVERVGRHNSFFDLGGHSLLATQLASRLRDTFGVEVPLRTLFEAPTVAELAVEVGAARLSGAGRPAPPPLTRAPRSGALPLSFGQQRLWFLEQLTPGSTAYHMPSAFKIHGALDLLSLRQAFAEIVRRHEVLRTTFFTLDGEPLQLVGPAFPLAMPLVDLRALPAASREREVVRLAAADARLPFDLRRGPLLRVTLLRVEAASHAVLATMHHIASDGWSQGLLLGEMAKLYQAFVAGEPSPLPDLPVQYADFAAWQRGWLTGPVLAAELAYWREQLRDLPPALDLPADRPRRPDPRFRGDIVFFRLPTPLGAALRALARGQRATLFMVLLAAFELLLSRWSGQADILVGTPVAGRERAELEGLIGFFLNTLVLRTDLSGEPTFAELLARVRTTALGAYAHQAVPFERLLPELNPERALGRTPVFQVLFNMLNLPQPDLQRSGLRLESLPPGEISSKFDLTVYAADDGTDIHFNVVYDADLFDRARMEALAEQLTGLLGQIAAHPDDPVSRYSLVTGATRALLPDPAAVLDTPEHEPVSQSFLAVSRRQPHLPAVRQGGRTWTYAELADWALALGGYAEPRRIAPGQVVAVTGRRSPELIGSLLAVFLHGGVLLLLDRKLPAARQRAMLAQAGATLVLYAGEPRAEDRWLWELPDTAVIPVSEGRRGPVPAAESGPLPPPGADDPAYIFFTSGTTGTPKGILGRQKGLAHFVAWQRERFAIGNDDRVAQLTGLSFDVVLREILLPLTSGALLCLPEEDDLSADHVLPWMAEQEVTVLHTVPSLAGLWVGRMPPGVRPPAWRWVFFAGEPLSARLVTQWRRTFPETGGIVNLYGPTETTLAKCFYHVPTPPAPVIQPVGAPLPQTQVLVLAGGPARLCGVGEPGEIVVRTPFRSLGYLADPGDRPPRFRANPFREDAGDLLYFTGDRGRYRPDGLLEILGRLDDQVKIRGMRVEPAETAAVLSGLPGVAECAVVARPGGAGELDLVAYVVPRAGGAVSPAELRPLLAEQLPVYMVPAAFVPLAALPLTANGKLDRRALPAPEAAMSDPNRHVGPRDGVEAELVRLWEELLPARPIGVRDNFFELGGHSLLVLRLKADVQERFGYALALADFFRGPTVEEMAMALRRETGDGPPSPLIPLRTGGDLPPLFCVHPAGGLVLGYGRLVEHLGPEIPVYGLQARGIESDEEPHTRLEEMARYYLAAVRAAQPEGPYHLAGWSFGGRVAFEMARHLTAAGQTVALLALLDSAAPAGKAEAREFSDLSLLLANVAGEVGLTVSAAELSALPEEGQLGHLVDLAVRAGLVVDRNAGITYLRRRVAVYRGNLIAASRHTPEPYRGPVTYFRAAGRPESPEVGATGPDPAGDPAGGWARYCALGIDIENVPGDHRTMMREPHVAVLAGLLGDRLRDCAAAQRRHRDAPSRH